MVRHFSAEVRLLAVADRVHNHADLRAGWTLSVANDGGERPRESPRGAVAGRTPACGRRAGSSSGRTCAGPRGRLPASGARWRRCVLRLPREDGRASATGRRTQTQKLTGRCGYGAGCVPCVRRSSQYRHTLQRCELDGSKRWNRALRAFRPSARQPCEPHERCPKRPIRVRTFCTYFPWGQSVNACPSPLSLQIWALPTALQILTALPHPQGPIDIP
jgi:hypothetical protein